MTSNLCIDIGNTRVKMAVIQDNHFRDYTVYDRNQIREARDWIANQVFQNAIYATVLKEDPSWLEELRAKVPVTRLSSASKIPLNMYYKSPETLGADRIAAMVAAKSQFPEVPLLVINAGTCITYDLVNAAGDFVGGNIAPGLEMRWRAMHEFTASLPLIRPHDPGLSFLGYNTVTAMENGGVQGVVLEIEGYFYRLRKNYSELKCVITGGNAPFLVNHLKIGIFAEPYLVLKGLNIILNYQ
ncbi:MAG TPA: type III pantothenate kinase [Saprospiraceae bacterium]|nr:type III pantothenate kinase [Saprospiraceae bacterium]